MNRHTRSGCGLLCALLVLAGLTGCVGSIRETTTQRTSTEQLLLSTAAERAIAGLEPLMEELKGRRVAIDESRFESYDKGYVTSALRHFLSERGAVLTPLPSAEASDDEDGDEALEPELILEVRSGALGINDDSWGIGIPPLPLPVPNTDLTTMTPAAYLFARGKQTGWAKLQLWAYDVAAGTYVARSGDLWGRSYYSTWWLFFIGPFDFSNDIYPDDEQLSTLPEEDEEAEGEAGKDGDEAD